MSPQQKCTNGADFKKVAEKIADSCNESHKNWATPGTLSAGGGSVASNINEQIFGQSCGSLLEGKDASGNWIAKVPEASTEDACELYGALSNFSNSEQPSAPAGASAVSSQHRNTTGSSSSGSIDNGTAVGNSRAINVNGAVIPGGRTRQR